MLFYINLNCAQAFSAECWKMISFRILYLMKTAVYLKRFENNLRNDGLDFVEISLAF